MGFPEECMHSCIRVCQGFTNTDKPVWFLPFVVYTSAFIGFLTGRYNLIALIKEFDIISVIHKLRPVLLFFVHRAKQCDRNENCSPQTSPKSSSSLSPAGSFRQSPLLLGSRKSTPSSSISNTDSPRRDLSEFLAENGSSLRRPKPLCIPISTSSLDPETPKFSPAFREHGQALVSGDATIPAAAWMCGEDVAGLELQCDLKWLDSIEVSLEGVYGEDWLKSVHPDDILHCKEVVASALSGKKRFQMEYRLQVGQDHYRWVLDIGKPRFSCKSPWEFLGFVGWRIDIHERKTIEHNYWKYWTLPHEFLVNWNGEGQYFDNVSPAFPPFLGYAYEEFMALPWMDLVHEEDKALTLEAFSGLKEGKVVVSLINRYRCKSTVDSPKYVDSTGSFKWLNWTASHMFAACRDITADKLAQEELIRSQQELQRITDVIPGGVFLCRATPDGTETFPYMSKGALSLLNVDKRATNEHGDLRRVFGLNVHPDDWSRLEGEMHQAINLQAALDHDYRIVRDIGVRWVRVHAVPRVDSGGSVEWSGIAWDITEQHQVVAGLKEARDIAERAAQSNRKFLAHMSHEIRTPMNAVIGMGALLLETDLTDEQRDYASTIRSSGEALLGIINDILDYSKIEAGKMELEMQPTDILRCVEESFDLLVPQAALKNLELTYSVSESVPSVVLGDSTRIRQILVNLLSNAVKFTEHGSISVDVEGRQLEEPPKGYLNGGKPIYNRHATQTFWEIEFSVSDSGIGIPEYRKGSLFQAFTQVDTSTTRRYGGTGLGLAICSRLCALHGGCIWAESNCGSGSIFRFTIIAEEAPTHAHNIDENDTIPNLRNKRILIVAGSSSSTQTMCARLLKSWHMRPVSASNSEEALNLLHKMVESTSIISRHPNERNKRSPLAFDAVIFDCSLLDAEDPQVMECLSICHTSLQTVPTLLLIPFGRRTQDYYIGRQPVHFDGYVSKPVKESQLLNALVNLLVEVHDSEDIEYTPARKPVTPAPSNLSDIGKLYPLCILVAEDNIINQKVIMKLLVRLGYTADVVGNGREALDSVVRQTYDVILMDCFMPEMDGLEASRRIRETIKPTPIIVAVTAAALEEEMQACLQAGMQMYISKPIQADELMHTLGKCWQMKKEQ